MSKDKNAIDIESRIRIIKQYPLFSDWPSDLLDQFACLWSAVRFKEGRTIVVQGEPINEIYLILSGLAEVSIRDQSNPLKNKLIATLNEGESIGLGESGLYSTSDLRTATVIAATPMRLIKTNINILQDFFKSHPQLKSMLHLTVNRVLKVQLAKHSAPFSNLTPEQLNSLADKIIEVDYPKKTILFKQGDIGDYSYLLAEGKVEIIKLDNTKNTQVIAAMRAGDFFGETAILLNAPRSATAVCLTACKLLCLHRDDLIHLTTIYQEVQRSISNAMLKHSRPDRFEYIIEQSQKNDEQEMVVILKNPTNKNYYQLSEEGIFLWNNMDGNKTIEELTLMFEKKYGVFDPEAIAILVWELNEEGFIKVEGFHFPSHQDNTSTWGRIIDVIRNTMEAKYALPNADQWVSKTYQQFFKFFFTKPMLFLLSLISLSGIILFGIFSVRAFYFIDHANNLTIPLLLAIVASYVSLVLHELAHAYTTKYFNREVHHFGVGWYWLGPVAYTDTSDMWLCPKWPRIAVDLAGIFLDSVLAAISIYIAWIVKTPDIIIAFWAFAFFLYVSIYRNLFPLIEMDGYYFLMNYFNRPHLREDSLIWLTEVLSQFFHRPVFIKTYRIEIIYWLICLFFLVTLPLISWFMQYVLLGHFFRIFRSEWWMFLFPLIALSLSLLSVWNEIRKKRLKDKAI